MRIANSVQDIFTRLPAHRRVYREEGVENSREPCLLPTPCSNWRTLPAMLLPDRHLEKALRDNNHITWHNGEVFIHLTFLHHIFHSYLKGSGFPASFTDNLSTIS